MREFSHICIPWKRPARDPLHRNASFGSTSIRPPNTHVSRTFEQEKATTERIPAVGVIESDMLSVLRAYFGTGKFEIELDRDVYTITARRKLPEVSVFAPNHISWMPDIARQTEKRKFIRYGRR